MNNQAPNLNSSLNSSLGIAISTQAFSSLPRFEQMKRARQLIMSYRESAFAALRDLQELKRFTNNDIDDFLRTVTRNTYGTENPIYKQEERINAYLQDLERYEDIINKAASNDTVNLPNLLSLAQTGFKDLNINQIQTAQSVDKGIQNDMVFHRFGAVAAGGTVGFFFGGVPGAIGGAVTAGEAYSTSGELSSRLQGLDPGPSKSFGLSVGEWIKTGSVDNLESAFINKFGDATIGLVGGVTTQFFILVQSALSLMGVCPALATFATASLASFNNAWDSVSTSWDPKLSYEQKEKIYEKNKHEYASKLAFMFFFTKVASMLNKSMPRVTTEEKFNGKTLDLVPDGKGGYYYASDVQAASGKLQTLASQYPTFAKASASGDLAVIQQLALSAGLSSGDMAPIVTLLKSPSFEALNRILKDSVFSKAMQTAQTTSTQPAALTADKLITNTKYTNGLLEPQIAQLKGLEPGQLKLYKELVDSGKFQPLSALRTASGQNLGVKNPNNLVVASLGAGSGEITFSVTGSAGSRVQLYNNTGLEFFIVKPSQVRIQSIEDSTQFLYRDPSGKTYNNLTVKDFVEGGQIEVLGTDGKLITFTIVSIKDGSVTIRYDSPGAVVTPAPPANTTYEAPPWLQQRNRPNSPSSQQDSSATRLQRIQDLDQQAMASANAAINSSPIPLTRPVLTIGTHYTVPTVQPGHSLEWTIDGLQGVKIRITQSGVVFQKDPATEFEIINNGHVFSINGKIYQIKITIKKEGNSTIPNTIKINELSNHENYVKPGAIQIVSSDKSIAEYPLRLNQNRVVEMELDKDFIIELKDGEEINLKNVKYTVQIQRPSPGQVDLPPGTVSITLIGPDGQKFKTTLVESKQGKEFREASNDSKETIRQEGNYSVRYGADGKEISRTEIKPLGDTPIGLSNGLSLEMLNGKLILRDANGDVVQGSNTPSVSSELDLKSFKGNPIGVSSQGQIGITDISTNTIRPLVNNRIISLGGVDYHCQVEKGFGENNFKITFTNSGNGEKTRIRVDRSELSTLEENSPTAPKEPQNLQESQATTSSKKFKFNPLRLAIVIGVSLGLIGGSIWLVVWALHSLTRNNRAAKALLESLTVDELKDLMDALSKGRGGLPIPTLKTPDGKNFEEAKDFNLEIGTAKKKVTVKINDKGLYERIEGVDKLDDDELDKLMEALSNGRGGLPIPTLKTPDGKNFEEAKDFNLEIGTAKKKVTVKINDKGLYERIDFTKGSN